MRYNSSKACANASSHCLPKCRCCPDTAMPQPSRPNGPPTAICSKTPDAQAATALTGSPRSRLRIKDMTPDSEPAGMSGTADVTAVKHPFCKLRLLKAKIQLYADIKKHNGRTFGEKLQGVKKFFGLPLPSPVPCPTDLGLLCLRLEPTASIHIKIIYK